MVLFLHGLGATAEVWRQMLEAADPTWGGRWVIADLAGHGRSDPALEYSFEGHAADVADLVQDGSPLTAVGHSMGAVVGLALASGRFGVTVERTVGIGIKVAWTEEELARVAELAAKPSKWFEAREEAEAFFLRVAGLRGLATPGDALAASGVRDPWPDWWRRRGGASGWPAANTTPWWPWTSSASSIRARSS